MNLDNKTLSQKYEDPLSKVSISDTHNLYRMASNFLPWSKIGVCTKFKSLHSRVRNAFNLVFQPWAINF